MSVESSSTVSLAATIVASFVSNNNIAPDHVAGLIRTVKAALEAPPAQTKPAVQEPARPLNKLVTPDAIFCAECGTHFKSLKRHLRTDHNLTPHAYRAKWGLKKDSSIVAPNYSATRSELARKIGLCRDVHKPAATRPSGQQANPTKPAPKTNTTAL